MLGGRAWAKPYLTPTHTAMHHKHTIYKCDPAGQTATHSSHAAAPWWNTAYWRALGQATAT